MKRWVAGALLLALVALAFAAVPVRADPLNLSYSDPSSDVAKLWTSNGTAVLNPDGTPFLSPFPDAVNLQRLDSANDTDNVTLALIVKGSIANLDNTTYEIRLYTRADNRTHFFVTYVNGTTTFNSNATGFVPKDITGNSTVTSSGPNPTIQNMLRITVAKALLETLSYWNIDATAKQSGSTYLYEDTIWEVPGNPGSTPPTTQTPSNFLAANWLWLVLGIVAIAAIAAVVLLARRRRKPTS